MSHEDRSTSLSYSTIEVRSYLPPGWNLESAEGEYEPSRRCWKMTVQDVSEFVSTLAVDEKDADELGRIPALRAAIDRLVRRV